MTILRPILFFCSVSTLLLSGCGAGSLGGRAVTSPTTQSIATGGSVRGGQQPVSGAHVYLMAASAVGYGSASTSLLTSGSTDSVGTYVLSDSGGNFNLTGNYTCAANSQVYVLALGGNSGSGTNSMIGLMSVLGNCPASGSLSTQVPFVVVNEVSTVAAAYALSGYAVDSTHVASSGTTAALSGLANAAQNAFQLNAVTSSTGALATTPTDGGTVPQALLNTLGNILAACVNSPSPASLPCVILKTGAPNGTTLPTDTATVAINIAHNPGANITALYGLASASAPFQPSLGTQPADFSVTLTYPEPYISNAQAIAIDAGGNTWVTSPGYQALIGTTPLGVYNYGVAVNGYIQTPEGVAIDPSGNVWYNDNGVGFIGYFSPTANSVTGINYSNQTPFFAPSIALDSGGLYATQGTSASGPFIFYNYGTTYTGRTAPLTAPYASAVDSNAYFWVTSNASGTTSGAVLLKYKRNGGYVSTTCTGTNYAQGTGVAIDSGNNAWVSDAYSNKLVEFTNACVYTTSYSTITAPTGLAIDGNNTLFTLNAANKLGATTTSGVAVSPAAGYTLGVTGTLVGPAIDGSGNVWLVNQTTGALHVVIGIAAPVLTPLSVASAGNKLGSRP